jgi:hypothetical protein
MLKADILNNLNFVLEFTLPKEISDNQERIKLSVHNIDIPTVKVPVCPIGYASTSIRFPGEIHCIECYKFIKDILPLIDRWVNSIYCSCSRSNQFVEAKLYAYKNNNLFKKWNLVEFYPLCNTYRYANDDLVGLKFGFENVTEVEDKPMYDISKYIKEYKDRENNCKYCAYHHIQGGRCNQCEDHDWFIQDINLKQYIIKRVSEDSNEEFKNSKEAIDLKAKVDLRKNVYDDFNEYVEKQKEILDQELEDKRKEWSDLQSEYDYKMAWYVKDSIDRALYSLY